jgi:hypothetical protein
MQQKFGQVYVGEELMLHIQIKNQSKQTLLANTFHIQYCYENSEQDKHQIDRIELDQLPEN